ncbi:hypothetical protein O181_038904 [Austropuccinia psidii MF-1]|uniref:Uncharacterized protein n=1 Tax=Austropuccinia psidii MF-1 TaxID=1389203 RepID=A0A9Q3D995_9BASI|nr:hypothetical protein [Austropuccinia psidii MF-1]
MGRNPWPMGQLGPFWPNFNEAKRGQGGKFSSPKPQVGLPEPFLTTNGQKTTLGHKLAINQSMAPGNHQRPPDQLQASIPLQFRERLPLLQCTPYSRTRSGAIWYNIPLCTIYAQKSNGDTFRTRLCNSK